MTDRSSDSEERPTSISALRSRFEALGSSDAVPAAIQPKPSNNPGPSVRGPGVDRVGSPFGSAVDPPRGSDIITSTLVGGRSTPRPDEKRGRTRRGSGSSLSISLDEARPKLKERLDEVEGDEEKVERRSESLVTSDGSDPSTGRMNAPVSPHPDLILEPNSRPGPSGPILARPFGPRPSIPPKPSVEPIRIPYSHPVRPEAQMILSPAVSEPVWEVDRTASSEREWKEKGSAKPDLPPRQRRPPVVPPRPCPPLKAVGLDMHAHAETFTQEPEPIEGAGEGGVDEVTRGLALPPRLPQRNGTIGSRVRDEPSVNGAAGSSAGTVPLPPPVRRATGGLNASRKLVGQPPSDASERTESSKGTNPHHPVPLPPRPTPNLAYIPPLPPTRSNTPLTPPHPSRSRNVTLGHVIRDEQDDLDGDGSEDDTEQSNGIRQQGGASLGRSNTLSAAQRAMEEYPDSTNAFKKPPDFTPRQHYSSNQTLNSYAVCGHKLCTGGHSVRIYDLIESATRPIFSIDPAVIPGFLFAGKDPTVTSMCFRTASDPEDEGRYLWCGMSVGHIIEIDTKTGQVTHLKSKIHSTSINYIFRAGGHMLTLEENGRCHVFGPYDTHDAEKRGRGSATPIRTIRTIGGQSHARIISKQLWSSTAPLSRSTTNAVGSKGPTIRVYDILGESSESEAGLRTTFTTEWTGSVTAAAVLSREPDVVYLGHEGGFVSKFDRISLHCLAVTKISPTDVLALEGIGDKLWAGFRNGVIQVYDVSTSPWTATNSWSAHPGQSISSIVIDPLSITQSGRFAVWSRAGEALHAWDGLLSVEWIENRLIAREKEFCTFESRSVLVCSWNVDSAKPSDLTGPSRNTSFLEEVLRSVEVPDIIVFGLQEVIDLNDKKLSAKTLLFGNKNKGGAGLADNVSGAYRQWQEKTSGAVRQIMPLDCPYTLLYSESMVGLLTVVFVKSSLRESLDDAAVVTVKRGLSGIYGNKGAIVARMAIQDTSICFINVHLAAGQRAKASRNADVAAILEEKAVMKPGSCATSYINGGDGSTVMDHEMVILSGDLNYRVDLGRDTVIRAVQEGNLTSLLQHDQLLKERKNNPSFRLRSFEEPAIDFAPTYKYTRRSDVYDTSEKMRIPAWCDRILYRSRDPARIRDLHYRRYEIDVSDHRPISAGFEIKVKTIDHSRYEAIREDIQEDWWKHEMAFLKTMLVGLSDE